MPSIQYPLRINEDHVSVVDGIFTNSLIHKGQIVCSHTHTTARNNFNQTKLGLINKYTIHNAKYL